MLEFRAALLLGHATAARTLQGRLTERTDGTAELLVMRAWTEAAYGRTAAARAIIRPVLEGAVPALDSHTPVEAFLLETALALAVDERPEARRALQAALTATEPLDCDRSPRPEPASARSSRSSRCGTAVSVERTPSSSGRWRVRRWRGAADDVEPAGAQHARAAAVAAVVG
jgi:hypothetical protein